jgi:phosphatidylserine synthase
MAQCPQQCLGSVTGFLPTIVKGLGYSDANAQLLTVPPYVVALVFMLLMSAYSDARQTRGIPVAIVFSIAIVGWAILLAVPAVAPTYSDLHARYFGCICIVTAGCELCSVLYCLHPPFSLPFPSLSYYYFLPLILHFFFSYLF